MIRLVYQLNNMLFKPGNTCCYHSSNIEGGIDRQGNRIEGYENQLKNWGWL